MADDYEGSELPEETGEKGGKIIRPIMGKEGRKLGQKRVPGFKHPIHPLRGSCKLPNEDIITRKTTTRHELVKKIRYIGEFTVFDARKAYAAVFAAILTELEAGNGVELQGIGWFYQILDPPHKYYSLTYKERIFTPPRRRVQLELSETFRKRNRYSFNWDLSKDYEPK